MESPLRLLPLECTQAHSHHEQNKIQTVTVNLTQCDCLYPCPFHITSLVRVVMHRGWYCMIDHDKKFIMVKKRNIFLQHWRAQPVHRLVLSIAAYVM